MGGARRRAGHEGGREGGRRRTCVMTTSTSESSTETPTESISYRIWNLRPDVAWLSVEPVRVRSLRT